jgi:hypothetical protein
MDGGIMWALKRETLITKTLPDLYHYTKERKC